MVPTVIAQVLFLLLKISCLSGAFHFNEGPSLALVERGKKQYRVLEQNTQLPQYGECWLQALHHLEDGCRTLTDSIQMDVALHFTNCFMEMSGQERLDCVSERTAGLKKLCMSEMTDRAFAVYTEFFTQTQSMCFFLQSQRWHQDTEKTVDRLSVHSRQVSEQLAIASGVQESLLKHQQQSLELQSQMLTVGLNLSDSLNGSQQTLEKLTHELKTSTEKHSAVLEELFQEFYLLHSWIVGRYAFVDCVIFYVTLLFIILVATSMPRTIAARTHLLVSFVACLTVECLLWKLGMPEDIISLNNYCWLIRKLGALVSVVVFIYRWYRYDDPGSKMLNEIREQNRQIMDAVLRLKLQSLDTRQLIFQARKSCHQDEDDDKKSQTTTSHSVDQSINERLPTRAGYSPKWETLSPIVESQTVEYDYEKENSYNERRSNSRLSNYSPDAHRASSRTSESGVSRTSRYNLRRKTIHPTMAE